MSFADDYYGNYGGIGVDAYVDRYIRQSEVQMSRIRRTLDLIPAEATSVLDVGAGHGVLLEELAAARRIKGVGIEITPSKVEYARARGVDLRVGTAERLEFDDDTFDAVLACEVIEHLPFGVYERTLRELARVSRNAIIVSVPNEERRVFVTCPYCGASVNSSYHFRTFSAASLVSLIPGFSLRQVIGVGSQRSSRLLALGLRVLDAGWPDLLVCPCCGYRTQSNDTSRDGTPSKERWFRNFAQRASRFIPARTKSTWLIGLFLSNRQA